MPPGRGVRGEQHLMPLWTPGNLEQHVTRPLRMVLDGTRTWFPAFAAEIFIVSVTAAAASTGLDM